MIGLQKFLRSTKGYSKVTISPIISTSIQNSYSNKASSSDDEKDDKAKIKTNALNKLNSLLLKMVEEDVDKSKTKLNLAKPKSKKEIVQKSEKPKVPADPEKQLVNAVKDVAQTIGGNAKQTESELLTKLLNPIKEQPADIAMNLSDIMRGMKIDRESKAPEVASRAQQVKQLLQMARGSENAQGHSRMAKDRPHRRLVRAEHQESVQVRKIDLFGSETLGIFTEVGKASENVNRTWQMLHERELRLAITHPPSNYFQEMILWTQQGKLWKFPIDNEQGMDDEQGVYFTDHVFLDKHLEPWCPSKGPIRHFMELVCVGLSKNPYLSVKHKREHIEWFRDYFDDKKQLLKEIGAVPADHIEKEKQISS